MDELTLREVCNRIGVSRRAVQGYESAGLVNAAHKNERGYLLYDEKAQGRIFCKTRRKRRRRILNL